MPFFRALLSAIGPISVNRAAIPSSKEETGSFGTLRSVISDGRRNCRSALARPGGSIRKDPVKFRVAIPAVYPPNNACRWAIAPLLAALSLATLVGYQT